MSNLKIQAEAAASRVDESEVGIDPITIITIITTVLPLLIKCFSKNDEPDEAETRAAVVKANDRNPRQLERRTTQAVMRENRTLTRSQAKAIGQAIIEQTIEMTGPAVAACCKEAG